MTLKKRLITAAAITACLPLLFMRGSVSALPAEPNVIFILVDDQRLEDINHMPNLQHLLVQQGMQFENYFSNVSLCCPSRTSILRGQFAHNTGVMTNNPPTGGFSVAHANGLENSTVAVWMHEQGYRTALIGKYLNQYPGNLGPTYIPPGWDYWASSPKGNPYSEYNYILNENGNLVSYGNKPEDYGTDVYTNKAVSFIKSCEASKKPFFMYLAFYAPHGPATPAPRHMNLFADARIPRTSAFNEADLSRKPQYIQRLPAMTEEQIASADAYYGKRLRSLQAVDEAIETICKTLAQAHQLDNTYIAFASDNGFHLGEHRMQRGKMTAYETDIHLPLIVRGPGIKPGSKAYEIAGNIDLAPTFATLAGARIPDFVDGRSLVPILKGQTPKEWRQTFLVEHLLARGQRARNGARRRRLSETDFPGYGDSMAVQGAGSGSLTTAVYYGDRAGHSESASELSLYGEEERLELAQENNSRNNAGEDSLQMIDPANSDLAQPGRRRGRRQAGAGEMGGIPTYSAMRHQQSTFVEYDTGEREYYKLMDDPDELNNLVDKTPPETLQGESRHLKELSASAAQAARHLESQK